MTTTRSLLLASVLYAAFSGVVFLYALPAVLAPALL